MAVTVSACLLDGSQSGTAIPDQTVLDSELDGGRFRLGGPIIPVPVSRLRP